MRSGEIDSSAVVRFTGAGTPVLAGAERRSCPSDRRRRATRKEACIDHRCYETQASFSRRGALLGRRSMHSGDDRVALRGVHDRVEGRASSS